MCNSIQSPLFQKGLKDRTLVTAIPQKINKDEIGKVNIISGESKSGSPIPNDMTSLGTAKNLRIADGLIFFARSERLLNILTPHELTCYFFSYFDLPKNYLR